MHTVIINGGNPLEGCPKNWEQAIDIQDSMNDGKNDSEPKWSFDCGFKLDFDGEIISISSRFYPPKSHYGPTWDGTVSVFFLGNEILEKKFDCSTLEELKKSVETYVNRISLDLRNVFTLPEKPEE